MSQIGVVTKDIQKILEAKQVEIILDPNNHRSTAKFSSDITVFYKGKEITGRVAAMTLIVLPNGPKGVAAITRCAWDKQVDKMLKECNKKKIMVNEL